jgi:hypothetical protein
VDLGLNFANGVTLGGDGVADHLRIGGGDVAQAIGHSQ